MLRSPKCPSRVGLKNNVQSFSNVAVDLTILVSAGRRYRWEAQNPASSGCGMVGWGLNCCQSTVSAGRRYNGSTRDHTPPYRRAADTVVPSHARTSFLCTLVYRRAADTIGFRRSTMLGSNCASADTLSSTTDTLTPLVQAGSLYLHTRICKICRIAVHALRYPSELIAEIIRFAAFLNTDAEQVALCVDTRET